MKSKILFICKERSTVSPYGYGYGKSVGLINSASFVVNYLNEIGLESKLSIAIDANSIDKEVFAYKPTHVIIEALWVTSDKLKELMSLKRYENITWIVRIHSKIPFIANEGTAFKSLVGYSNLMEDFDNLYISTNSPEFMDDLKKIFRINGAYLPNIYYPKNYHFHKEHSKKCHLDVGCFGAIRPMKNTLMQAIAAIEYGEEIDQIVHFHVNSDRQEQRGDCVYKNLRDLFSGTKHKLIDHSWMEHREFIEVVKTMDIGLQVSMSETFNIVAADFISNDVPLIGSPDITWIPKIFQADPNSSQDIVSKIRFILDTKELGIYKLNKIYLKWYNNHAKKIWRDFLR